MANRMQGEVEIVLDKRRLLKVNHRARRAYEQAADGQTLNQFFDTFRQILERHPLVPGADGEMVISALAEMELIRDVSVEKVSAALWACLEWGDRLLTIEQAAELIDQAEGGNDDARMAFVIGKLWEAYAAARGIDPEMVKKRVAELRQQQVKKEEGPPSPPEPRGGGDPSSSSPRSGSGSPTTNSGA